MGHLGAIQNSFVGNDRVKIFHAPAKKWNTLSVENSRNYHLEVFSAFATVPTSSTFLSRFLFTCLCKIFIKRDELNKRMRRIDVKIIRGENDIDFIDLKTTRWHSIHDLMSTLMIISLKDQPFDLHFKALGTWIKDLNLINYFPRLRRKSPCLKSLAHGCSSGSKKVEDGCASKISLLGLCLIKWTCA